MSVHGFENPLDYHWPSRGCFARHFDGLQRDSLLTSDVYGDQLKVGLGDSKAFVSLKRTGKGGPFGSLQKDMLPIQN